MTRILVVDGQGGRLGRMLVEGLLALSLDCELLCVGTNGAATAAMLRAGATRAATGENAVCVCCRHADVIVGPVGILCADALLGEITPAMAAAVGAADAEKVLVPVSGCAITVAGTRFVPLAQLVEDAVETVACICKNHMLS